MHLHASMSPLAKPEGSLNYIKGYENQYDFDTRIANPFIEKSDIFNHKVRQNEIG